jgi:cyclic pyranopterin phosphate synthase
MSADFTHLDEEGAARMVDVGGKPPTERAAEAEGWVRLTPEAYARVRGGDAPKGDVLAAARLAGIQAGKRTGLLIPLCHQVPLDALEIGFRFDDAGARIGIHAAARARWSTGVEMEALTAVSLAALTLYDMCKSLDRSIVIEGIRLLRKAGGRSGEFVAPPPGNP